ncbi:MAG: hypothetical protein WD691_06295 [Acidimicrobiales bacterium]
MTDDLELRLRAADPSPATQDVDDARNPRARALMEHVMTDPGMTTPIPLDDKRSTGPARRGLAIGAAAAVVLAIAIGAVALRDDDSRSATTIAAPAPTGGPSMGMCMQLTPEVLAPVDLAFDGTVTQIDGEQVTLAVSTWFKGGESDDVVVTQDKEATEAQMIELDGIQLEEGHRYLVTATGGLVNGCGFSGEYSEELHDIFSEAFAG